MVNRIGKENKKRDEGISAEQNDVYFFRRSFNVCCFSCELLDVFTS